MNSKLIRVSFVAANGSFEESEIPENLAMSLQRHSYIRTPGNGWLFEISNVRWVRNTDATWKPLFEGHIR